MKAAAEEYPSPNAAFPHPIDLPHTSRLYKTLLQGGHFNHTTKAVERVTDSWDAAAFSSAFLDGLGRETVVGMCVEGQGNGAFVIAELCEELAREDGSQEGSDKGTARKKLRGWFGADVRARVENGDAKGKKVLLEKLAIL